MKHGLSGYIPVRNGDRLDYCWREAGQSLLPVVDELILCDSDSDDATANAIQVWAQANGKVRYLNYPWPEPVNDRMMLPKWLNFIRRNCAYDMQLTLDADELIGPESHEEIRKAVDARACRWFYRHNFWQDPCHTAPINTVCGQWVVRLGPTELEMVSDGWYEQEPEIRQRAERRAGLNVYHYGFLRKRQAFFDKSKVMQKALHNCYDPRLTKAEQTGEDWVKLTPFNEPLESYSAGHPEIIRAWLRERGFTA